MTRSFFFVLIPFALFNLTAFAQTRATYKRKGFTLLFESQDPAFNPKEREKLVSVFFDVYPRLASEYNPRTSRKVTFVIDTAYDGVAATASSRVVFSDKYLKINFLDIDVVTHEVMHIVQDYGNSDGPVWLTEGIADYARNNFGVFNSEAGWSLPEYRSGQHYTDSYRVTARFLIWLESHVKPGLVKILDSQLRGHTYSDSSWKQLTGKSVDELWLSYSHTPAI
ncbi:MAG: secretory protein [Bacteroidota bacterium]|nr:secretory protein [Bacteroidota bacterium]